MGTIVSAHCDCGFEKNKMYLGGGRMNFMEECNVPYFCEDCNILFEGNALDMNLKCPKCSKDHISSYDTKEKYRSARKTTVFEWNVMDESGRELELTDGYYYCPGCRAFTLRLSSDGHWD